MAYPHPNSWTDRIAPRDTPEPQESQAAGGDLENDLESHARKKLGFRNPHESLGVGGHLVHMGAMLFPVLAAEFITDAANYKKAVRIGSVLTTVLYEGLYAAREARRRDRQEARLEECRQSR